MSHPHISNCSSNCKYAVSEVDILEKKSIKAILIHEYKTDVSTDQQPENNEALKPSDWYKMIQCKLDDNEQGVKTLFNHEKNRFNMKHIFVNYLKQLLIIRKIDVNLR